MADFATEETYESNDAYGHGVKYETDEHYDEKQNYEGDEYAEGEADGQEAVQDSHVTPLLGQNQKFDRPPTRREIAAQQEIEVLQEELSRLDDNFPACQRLLQLECYRIRGGVSEVIDVVGQNRKTRVRTRLMLPVDQYPGVNIVGKLLGKGGSTLKKLQEETQTKLSILGAGSMRGQDKEYEALMSGDPKFQHLRLPMHLQIDCLAEPEEAFYRVSHAVSEAKKLMTPSPEEMANMYSQQQSFGSSRGGGNFGGGFGNFGGDSRGSRGRGGPGRFGGSARGGRGGGRGRGGFSQEGTSAFGSNYAQQPGGGRFPRGGSRGSRGQRGGPYSRGGQQ